MKRKLILLVLTALSLGTAWGQATPPHVAIGDILCNDGTTVRREDWPQDKTPVGIVFYVAYRDDGWHGSAIGLNEAHGLRWANAGFDGTILGNTATTVVKEAVSDMEGAANTRTLVEAIGSNFNETNYPALYYATQMQQGEGWYLPAMGQLHYLYGYIDEINATVAKLNAAQDDTATPFAADPDGTWSYWPSTEYKKPYSMWFLNYNGDCADAAIGVSASATPAQKGDLKRVRAAIDF